MKDKSIWEILVPTVNNDGKPFKTRFHRVWDSKVRELVGGLTIMQPNIKGEWVVVLGISLDIPHFVVYLDNNGNHIFMDDPFKGYWIAYKKKN